jgi:hypothetical protein
MSYAYPIMISTIQNPYGAFGLEQGRQRRSEMSEGLVVAVAVAGTFFVLSNIMLRWFEA